jgi:hypothetical protein
MTAQRNLVENGGWLDEVLWLANTNDEEDLEYLDEIVASNPAHKKIIMPDNEILGYFTWYKAYQYLLERGRYYIKIDDDVVRHNQKPMIMTPLFVSPLLRNRLTMNFV